MKRFECQLMRIQRRDSSVSSITLRCMEVVDLPDFGPDDYAKIVDGELDPYGTDHLNIDWREKSGHVGLMDDRRLIGHAGWVPARARAAAGQIVEVVGLGGVMVHREYRGKGVGQGLVVGAMKKMHELQSPIGMLFCRTERVRFYERMGWHPIEGRITADQSDGLVEVPLVACWTPLVAGASLPATELHIEGLPF